eukprot:4891436-Pyramimonas_sp.AAC.2
MTYLVFIPELSPNMYQSDYGTTEGHYATTASLAHKGEQNHKAPPKSTKLIAQKNYYREVQTDRTHSTLPQCGFGSVLPCHPPNYGDSYVPPHPCSANFTSPKQSPQKSSLVLGRKRLCSRVSGLGKDVGLAQQQ